MTPLKEQTVYIPISVKERLPEQFKNVIIETNYPNKLGVSCIDSSKKWDEYPLTYDDEKITGWLEKKELICISKDELIELLQISFDYGVQRVQMGKLTPDRNTFIHLIIHW